MIRRKEFRTGRSIARLQAAVAGTVLIAVGGCSDLGPTFAIPNERNSLHSFNGAAGTFIDLHDFLAGGAGKNPNSLAFDSDGVIIGTTFDGGIGCVTAGANGRGCGTIFKLTPSGSGFVGSTVHRFTDNSNGAAPTGIDSSQNGLSYGATQTTWPRGCGTVFAFLHTATGPLLSTVHAFQGPDGCSPITPVVASDGKLYGATRGGGRYGFGTIFEITSTIRSGYRERVIYNFRGGAGGKVPNSLIMDDRGNFYGEASLGAQYNSSVIFKLSKTGARYHYAVLRSFPGDVLSASVIVDGRGAVFGAIAFSPTAPCGAVFKIDSPAAGDDYHVLHTFNKGSEGCLPSSIAFGPHGNVFGATSELGYAKAPCLERGCGTIFELIPRGASSKLIVLHTFRGRDGEFPLLDAVQGNVLYGTTNGGGRLDCPGSGGEGCGTVWSLTLPDEEVASSLPTR